MNAWQKFGLFYAVAGLVFGTVIATSKGLKVEIGPGRPVPYPRIVAFFGIGLFWWAALLAIIVEPIFRKQEDPAAAVDEPATPAATSPAADSSDPSA